MFYHQEILTSRKYGVATVWLVATLGPKSNLKKVTRKAILDVDVPKACEAITNSPEPLALRLQSSLLYGVSRVYSQQCGYVLTDTQSFREKMRGVGAVLRDLQIDTEVGRARPDQLNLPDDPAFAPDLDMNLDLSLFDIHDDSGLSDLGLSLSPRSIRSSRSSLPAGGEGEVMLDLPSLDTLGNDFAGFDMAAGMRTSSVIRSENRAEVGIFDDESPIVENPEFEIDEEGNVVDIQSVAAERRSQAPLVVAGSARLGSESGLTERVQAEHDAAAAAMQQQQQQQQDDNVQFDDGGLRFGEDDGPLPPALPLSPLHATTEAEGDPQLPASEHESVGVSSSTAEAPQRRIRAPRGPEVDDRAELTNRQLNEWNANYLANMAATTRAKEQNKSAAKAKKDAAFWVLRQGIGNVEATFGADRNRHPLSVFSGQALLDALTGLETSPAGSKRARSPTQEVADEDDEGVRRVRARTSDEQVGRGEDNVALPLGEDEGMLVQGDDDNIESEVGRHAPPSLPDISSQMPWNSASRHSSARPLGSGLYGISSSIGGPGGFSLGRPPLSRRGSRLTSASPLLAKGQVPSRQGSLGLPEEVLPGLNELENTDMPLFEGEQDDFELYGPAADVDTQTAAQSQWLTSTLEAEAHNFLTFLDAKIQARMEAADDVLEDNLPTSVTFQELLPDDQHSRQVAAQGLLHVLALATKGLIEVNQGEAFGDIEMQVVHKEGTVASQVEQGIEGPEEGQGQGPEGEVQD